MCTVIKITKKTVPHFIVIKVEKLDESHVRNIRDVNYTGEKLKNWFEFLLFWSPMTGPLPSLNAFSLLSVVKNTLGNNTANWMAPTMRLASHSQQQSFCMATSFFPVTGELKYQNTMIHFLMGENEFPK